MFGEFDSGGCALEDTVWSFCSGNSDQVNKPIQTTVKYKRRVRGLEVLEAEVRKDCHQLLLVTAVYQLPFHVTKI